MTDQAGNVREIVGIAREQQIVVLQMAAVHLSLMVQPNQVWRLDATKSVLARAAPFDYPYQDKAR